MDYESSADAKHHSWVFSWATDSGEDTDAQGLSAILRMFGLGTFFVLLRWLRRSPASRMECSCDDSQLVLRTRKGRVEDESPALRTSSKRASASACSRNPEEA